MHDLFQGYDVFGIHTSNGTVSFTHRVDDNVAFPFMITGACFKGSYVLIIRCNIKAIYFNRHD